MNAIPSMPILVKARLCRQIAWLSAHHATLDLARLLDELDGLRRIAAQQRLTVMVDLVHAFEQSLARGRCHNMAGHYFDALADSIACDPLDARARGALLASVAIYGAP